MVSMFITNNMYLSFAYFLACPESPIYTSGVFPFPMLSGIYVNFFSIFVRYRKLALNMDFLFFRCRQRLPCSWAGVGPISGPSGCPERMSFCHYHCHLVVTTTMFLRSPFMGKVIPLYERINEPSGFS